MSAAPGTPEGDELDVLAILVDAYEAKHHPVDAPDPVAAIQFRMEQRGLKRRDLEPLIGSRARVSEVLTRKRNLTLEMIRRVKRGLGISADLLIGAAPIKTRRHPATSTARNARRGRAAEGRTAKNSRKTV
jgi:HTH-type transcriptional regulator/antitoxin HigA